MNTQWIRVGLPFVLAFASAAAAAAQEGGDLATEEARGLFTAGRSAYDAGRFDQALDYFSQAYELSHRGALLFNMGSAAERLRRDAEALGYYRRYLQEVPHAENRQFVEARITFLRSATSASTRPAATAPTESEGPAATNTSLTPGVDSAPTRSVVEEWWLWTILAVVVIGAGVGIGLGVAFSDPGTEAPAAGNFGVDFVATTLVRF